MSIQLKKDGNGNIITKPVMGWITGNVAEIAVLLAIEYADTPQEIETGGKSIQFVLTPQQGLELAEKLTTLARKILDQPQAGKPPH